MVYSDKTDKMMIVKTDNTYTSMCLLDHHAMSKPSCILLQITSHHATLQHSLRDCHFDQATLLTLKVGKQKLASLYSSDTLNLLMVV